MRRLLLSIVPAVALLVVLPATAAQAQPERHCVIEVTGQQPDGEFTTTPAQCYATQTEALDSVGVQSGASAFSATSTFVIGIHYDGFNWTGSSMTVVGSDCGGGWLNVSAAWNNRIRSTYNGCPRIRHFDGYNLTGAWEDTVSPGGNLTYMDRNTSSIQYLS